MARKKTTGSGSEQSQTSADESDKPVVEAAAETDGPTDDEPNVEEPKVEETDQPASSADTEEPVTDAPTDEESADRAPDESTLDEGTSEAAKTDEDLPKDPEESVDPQAEMANADSDLTETPDEGKDEGEASEADTEAETQEAKDADPQAPTDLSDTKDADSAGAETAQDLPEADTAREKPAPQSAPTPAPKQQAANPGALVFGGVVAGAIGFAAAYFGLAQQPDPAIDGLASDISTLREEVSALAATPAPEPDLGPVLAQIDAVAAQLSSVDARFDETQALIDDVNARIDSIESAAVAETLPEGAQEAFAAELEAAKEAIAAERAALADMMAEAAASESEANEAAQAALRRAAMSEVVTALDTGAAFSAPLEELSASGVTVSDALMQSGASGVVPLTALQQSFPDAARNALEASRKAAEGTSGFEGFVRAQLGVRSLEPKEGDDPDAVLSRAEAALDTANLSKALAEIETLPPEALAALASWVDDATRRRDTVQAVQDLSDSLN